MMKLRHRHNKIPPTRLAAAWVLLLGGVGGLVMIALILPPFEHKDNHFTVDLPPTADSYASAVMTDDGRRPTLHQPVIESMVSETEEISETATPLDIGAPSLALTPVADDPPPLPLDGPEGGEVVITIPDQRSAPGLGPLDSAPGAPDPALMAKTATGTRPAIARDGRTPFSAYSRKDVRLPTAPDRTMAIMVSGLGLDASLTARAINTLPPEVTLSFAPYSPQLERYIAEATAKGHEVAIEIPMEQTGVGPAALGTAVLMTSHAEEANKTRLEWVLSRANAYPMVTNYLGTTFSQDEKALRSMLRALDEAGLAYVDDTGLAAGAAVALGLPYTSTNALIPPGTSNVSGRIGEMALRAGTAPTVIKVYASAGGLEGVLEWAQSDPRKNITLVPVSAATQ